MHMTITALINSFKSFLHLKPILAGVMLLCLAGLVSCEKALIEPDPADSPVHNFELLWKTVDEKYSFFTYKDINWDEVYTRYRPQVNNNMSQEELFDVMASMLYELRDGHVNLQSDFDIARNWDWFMDYPPNYNKNVIERHYLGKDYKIVSPFATKEINGVGYIRYASFLSPIDEETLDQLLERYKSLKGIIIDIRDNGGGLLTGAELLASRLAQKTEDKILVGYQRYKAGPGHDDFTKAFPVYIEPEESFDLPVVVLTNRSVYSAANRFVSYMSVLPNVTIIGDKSGGGGGAPYSGELYNGWKFNFSSTQLLDINQEQIEHGIDPDIKVDMLPEDEAQGKDTILETALDYILSL